MITRPLHRRRWRWLVALAAAGSFMVLIASASGTLTGSTFNAGDGNMRIDGTEHDWQDAVSRFGSSYTGDITDLFSSGSDNAFTPGQKQDTSCPEISGQSSPPKDDFTDAAYASETVSGDIFLYGATFRSAANGNASENIELNQGTNGKCPGSPLFQRVAGDRLLAIDYLGGGASAKFSALTWVTTGVKGDCFVGNDTPPCWGATVVPLDGTEAEGAINQTATADYIRPPANGSTTVDALKFAEFGVNLTKALGISGCGKITGVNIEARASGSSFVSSTKDIIIGTKPINPCQLTLVTSASGGTIGSNGSIALTDTATLSGGTSDATGTLTFNLYSDSTCSTLVGSNTKVVAGANGVSYTSDAITVFAAGTYHWRVKYDSADLKNASVGFTACGATGENPVVSRAPTSISTTLSASLIQVGSTVHDSATLSGATTNAGGSVTYSVFDNSACTGTPVASGGTKQVTNGVVPDSNDVTFNSSGTFYWQASYSGDVNNAPATSACTSEPMRVIGPCSLGYPDSSNPGRSNLTFSESEVLRAFGTFSTDARGVRVALFYNDEHALELGIRQNSVKTSTGTTVVGTYPVSPLTSNPSHVANPSVGSTDIDPGDADGIDQDGVDVALPITLQGKTGQGSQGGRPMFPALFVTDITTNTSDRSGDWQQGTLASRVAHPPDDVYGTWKSATRLVNKTTSPFTVTTAVDPDPAKNNWNLGAGSDTPAGGLAALKNEGYGAEASWNGSSLGLLSGHAYRLQFMDHDGDQNKSGGDAGEACVNIAIR
jgi:hypothetical protein